MNSSRSVHTTQDIQDSLKAPSWKLVALEARAPLELLSAYALWPALSTAPRGDGHPVLVFPGLGGSHISTQPLRRLLTRLGYATYDWEQGRNLGPRPGVLDACLDRIDELHGTHGRTLSLIGWSLGGIYARELAKRRAGKIRQVITLASPFTGPVEASNVHSIFVRLNPGSHAGKSGHRPDPDPEFRRQLRQAPPVPTTAIYSRSDGVVSWRMCVQDPQPHTENIEVEASHCGMGVNPAALYAVADRLAQPEGAWRPFDRRGLRRLVYQPAWPAAGAGATA